MQDERLYENLDKRYGHMDTCFLPQKREFLMQLVRLVKIQNNRDHSSQKTTEADGYF